MMNSLLKAHKTPYAQMVTPTQLKRQEGGVIKGSVVQQKTKDGLTEGENNQHDHDAFNYD